MEETKIIEEEKKEEKKKKLYILRGISGKKNKIKKGSGKSTLSNKIIEENGEGKIFSTDEYFMKEGKYVFDGKSIGKAHQWNQKRAFEAMKQGESIIIIDNTVI
jgi:uridine kinase